VRTTLDLDKPVLDGLKSLQKKEKIPLGKIASRLLADAMTREAANLPKTDFTWTTGAMGARVNLSDKEAVMRAMEDK